MSGPIVSPMEIKMPASLPSASIHAQTVADGQGRPVGAGLAKEYPVREYIGSMARELAQMARWDGDEHLARLLDDAGERAEQTTRD